MPRKLVAFLALLVTVGIGIVWLKLAFPFRPVQQAMLGRSITCRMTTGSAPSVPVSEWGRQPALHIWDIASAKAVNHIDTDLNWRISIASVPLRPGSLEIMPASGSWNLSLELSAKQGMDIDTNS